MAILKEIWAREIAEKLFPENSFMKQSISDDAWVSNKTAHLPQAGAAPTVVRNRSTLPATATQRTDTDHSYDLDEFTSSPTVIRDIEEVETSYGKRTSVVTSHADELNRQTANWMAFHWGPTAAANFIRTTGANRAANVGGGTGTRKMLKVEDLIKAKGVLDDMDVPAENRNILLPAHMYNDLLEQEWKDLVSLDKTGKARISDGQLMTLMGFNIHHRGKLNVLQYTNAATPVKRAPGANNLITANAAALIWHGNFVRRAKGSVKVYADYDQPEWYGSTFSALVRAGGAPKYTDFTGVMAIIESAGV